MVATINAPQEGWQANLHLRYKVKNNKTVLVENIHQGPLTVQRPLYPEGDVCHTYILHPPGGVVGGDHLNLDLVVENNSSALITTPGATKFYRSNGLQATQTQNLAVNGGTLEWFPQDTILHPGANGRMKTEVRLKNTSRFIGWEVTSLGLVTSGKKFTSGSLVSSLSVLLEDKPLFMDWLRIRSEKDFYSSCGLRGFGVCGCFVATGVPASLLPELRELSPIPDDKKIVGMTLLKDLLVARYLGFSTFEAREIFEQFWALLRPVLLNRQPCPPRIWAT